MYNKLMRDEGIFIYYLNYAGKINHLTKFANNATN